MGEGLSRKASEYYKLIALYSFLLNLFLGILIFFSRENLARIFTSSEELIPMIKDAYFVDILILLAHGFAMI